MGNKAKILLADDERDIVSVLKDYLEEEGYEVLSAFDGAEALRIVRAARPDLVILDLKIPEIDGETVLKTMAADESIRGTHVFVLTGFNDFEVTRDRIQNRYEGMVVNYIDKPVDIHELGSAITRYFDRREYRS